MADLAVEQDRVSPGGARLPVVRRELLFWIAGGLFANQLVQLLSFSSVADFAASLASQNYIAWFACFVVLKRIGESQDRSVTRAEAWLAVAMLTAIIAASVVPYRFVLGALTTMLAAYLLANRESRPLKAGGYVLLALSIQLVWAPIVFQLLTPELLSVDAALVGTALHVLRPDIVWTGTTFQDPAAFAISLVGACSSFHNLSTALLACAAATMATRTDWRRADIVRAAIACAAMIAMNVARLCLMAWSAGSHAFWHDGAGRNVIDFAMTFVLLAIAFYGQSSRVRR